MCWPSRRQPSNGYLARAGRYLKTHLNFYRIHILFFTFTPLICSGIFYASNGGTHIQYIDALFNSVSAVTVCGLATVDLSSLTPWQQVILFLQMCVGSPVVVSWVMVYVRREIFASKFRHVVEAEMSRRVSQKVHAPIDVKVRPWWKRAAVKLFSPQLSTIAEVTHSTESADERGRSTVGRLRPDMIRRMDDAPKLVNPSGHISEGQPAKPSVEGSWNTSSVSSSAERLSPEEIEAVAQTVAQDAAMELERELDTGRESADSTTSATISANHNARRQPEKPDYDTLSPLGRTQPMHFAMDRLKPVHTDERMPRTQTIEFAVQDRPGVDPNSAGARLERVRSPTAVPLSAIRSRRQSFPDQTAFPRTPSTPFPRTGTMPRTGTLPRTATSHTYQSMRTKHRNFGGFPMPYEIASRAIDHFFPDFKRTLTRTVTIPRTQTITSLAGGGRGAIPKPYITFEAIVGRNSAFERLTREQLDELGGVEYRSLTALLWIVGGYHILSQLIPFIIIAPYMSIHKWHQDFVPPMLHKPVSSTWFSLFQVVSAYTNTGMSLEDESMVPFQKAYPMIVCLIFLILAGNTAFPVFLRFSIWMISTLVPRQSRIYETLHFLLDHPRRCFIYLFPSHQTWFLLTVLIFLNATDWFFFLVLDIGNPALADIPTGVRVIIGLLQATAVRAAGFGTVSLSVLAPAVKVLYVLMMYVSVYPIAMSVRSTNVYEERSLGVYNDEDESMDEDAFVPAGGSRATIWSRYLAMHMRKQLAFDMWWLGLALFLVCIVERGNLEKEQNFSWFTIFTILFELVSAYGTVGLSLGVPYANYSFSGALSPLSKLIVCAVMLRGRHRGLPVAIDRAVILPFEFRDDNENEGEGDDLMSQRRESIAEATRNGQGFNGDAYDEKAQKDLLQRRSWRSSSVDSRQRTSRNYDSEDSGAQVS